MARRLRAARRPVSATRLQQAGELAAQDPPTPRARARYLEGIFGKTPTIKVSSERMGRPHLGEGREAAPGPSASAPLQAVSHLVKPTTLRRACLSPPLHASTSLQESAPHVAQVRHTSSGVSLSSPHSTLGRLASAKSPSSPLRSDGQDHPARATRSDAGAGAGGEQPQQRQMRDGETHAGAAEQEHAGTGSEHDDQEEEEHEEEEGEHGEEGSGTVVLLRPVVTVADRARLKVQVAAASLEVVSLSCWACRDVGWNSRAAGACVRLAASSACQSWLGHVGAHRTGWRSIAAQMADAPSVCRVGATSSDTSGSWAPALPSVQTDAEPNTRDATTAGARGAGQADGRRGRPARRARPAPRPARCD